MAKETINVEITSRATIRPCSPTPKHLRTLKLSLLDQLAPDLYIPLVLFYPFNINNRRDEKNPNEIASERSKHLRKTLSKALVHYYPLAGRLRNNLCVECNDDGVEFSEAKAACLMSDFLHKPDLEAVTKLVPRPPESGEASLEGRLLLVQGTIFECGGMSLGLSFSHKIFDACSVATFVKSWAEIAHGGEAIIEPEFGKVIDLFPQSLALSSSAINPVNMELVQDDKCVTRRYVFMPKKIEALKSKATSENGVKNPTRVEAVSGLIWKCAMEAWRSNNPGILRKSVWCHFVNIRKRIVPSLAETVAGNMISLFAAETKESECGIVGLEGLVGKLRRGIEELSENYANSEHLRNVQIEMMDYTKLMSSGNEINVYNCTSWCRFGLYESNFGWENPVWVSVVSASFKNVVVLMDTRDGHGIEAWMVFTEEDMAVIEGNEEFLAFASLNPSIH